MLDNDLLQVFLTFAKTGPLSKQLSSLATKFHGLVSLKNHPHYIFHKKATGTEPSSTPVAFLTPETWDH
ncbi:hypothetical protein C5Z25_09535 [Lactobacillus sp. CBA3605]|uniref:hypothetical protein n=1 Tax=Lactobacillus sp. CBA3605 TaxID=2099788 RepID=UPI000CFDD528|nr:hypothetical protein [Lactobacillus sp. CBA3605]AVK61998.1 hypothetical protein C5Z25_09535 [Lactobacillus sp. CBA3605]